jgi:CheY-like chemotaxis protein
LEIAAALEQGVHIIPVLVQGALMPRQDQLPDSIAQLARRQAFELSSRRWRRDVQQLIEAIERVMRKRVASTPNLKETLLPELRESVTRLQQIAREVTSVRTTPPRGSRKRKLLVADDSATIQKVIELVFTDENFDVTAVSDGAEALVKVEKERPDIVLADVVMPGPSGYKICAYIKSSSHLKHIPVVLLVGVSESLDEAEAKRVGADKVLTKPFSSVRELIQTVKNLLGD